MPLIADWIKARFNIQGIAVRDLGLRDAKDIEIFQAAREADAVILTKDADFPSLLSQHGPPPQIIWLTCGNTSNSKLQRLLADSLPKTLRFLNEGEHLVQISENMNEKS